MRRSQQKIYYFFSLLSRPDELISSNHNFFIILTLIYHGNSEQNICIYFLLKWCNFLFTGDILKRKSNNLEVSGNLNGTATTYFFEWQWFTYLASLYNPATSEAITNWVRYSTNAILRLASTLLSFSTSKAKRTLQKSFQLRKDSSSLWKIDALIDQSDFISS